MGFESRVMADHGNEVPGDHDVRFKRRHADRERAPECSERVLGCKTPRTAMALKVEGRCAGRCQFHEGRQSDEYAPDDADFGVPQDESVTSAISGR